MRKLILGLTVSAIFVGGALASSLEDSDVSNTVGIKNSEVVQHGYKNTADLGIKLNRSRVRNSTVNNEVYIENSSVRQRGSENYLHTGTEIK